MYTDDDKNYKDDYEEETNNTNNKSGLIKIILIVVLAIVLLILLISIFSGNGSGNNNDNNPPQNEFAITLNFETLNMNVGEKSTLTYKVSDETKNIKVYYSSSNPSVAIVNDQGEITGVSAGTSNIILSYFYNQEKIDRICEVTVSGEGTTPVNDKTPPELSLSIVNGQEGVWSNKDIMINANASSSSGTVNLKYAVNCTDDNNCNYINVNSNRIVVSESGSSVITVVATDSNNLKTVKSITVTIDKNAPTVTLDHEDLNIVSGENVTVCALCKDGDSGCVEEKVCKSYSKTTQAQYLTVKDKAGNETKTDVFNVTIDKNPPSCTLSASSGTVTAKVSSNAVQYGFDSNFSGGNETTKTFSVPTPPQSAGKGAVETIKVKYYVKNSIGTVATCSGTLGKELYNRWECNGKYYKSRKARYKESTMYSTEQRPSGVYVKDWATVDPSKCHITDGDCYKLTIRVEVSGVTGACDKGDDYWYYDEGLSVNWFFRK